MLALTPPLDWLQLAMALAIGPFLFWYYRTYVISGFLFATRYLGLTCLIVVLYLMVYGLLGVGLGIPYLFWHDDFWPRVFSSLGATMLLSVIGVIAYYLDPFPWATDRKNAEFLSTDEQIKHRIVSWYSRQLPRLSARAIILPPRPLRPILWSDYVAFGLNLLVDLVSITPFQSWLDPTRANSLRLQRFLRAARGPFLLLLLAPAVLPAVFTEVPRAAPTGSIGFEWLMSAGYQPRTLDVTRSFWGYALSLTAWLLGIQIGVLVIKGFVRYGTVLHDNMVGLAVLRAYWTFREAYRKSRGRARVVGFLHRVIGVLGGPRVVVDGGVSAGPALENPMNPDCVHARGDTPICAGSGCPRGELTRSSRSALTDCLARGQLRASALVFALLFLLTYAVLGFIRNLRVEATWPGWISPWVLRLLDLPPAFAICAMLTILAMLYATIAYLPRVWQAPVVVLGVIWLGIANNDPFKNRFRNMDYSKAHRVDLRSRAVNAYINPIGDPTKASRPPGLVVDRLALEAWKKEALAEGGPDIVDGKPKLVLVAVSGGATRSAYWTAVMLDQLERKLPRFGQRIRIISGASGGMLGTASYVVYRRDVARRRLTERQGAVEPNGSTPAVPSSWVGDVPCSSMDPLARYIALSEIWKAAWPGVTLEDRGIALERDWHLLKDPVSSLGPLEAQGKIPSLIFSPMIVEDGRRLLISNLDLFLDENSLPRPMMLTRGRQVAAEPSPHGDGTLDDFYSLSGLEYFRLFPEPGNHDLAISTAVRMSATFPFVSPAVNLPTDPPRRVVDAGYYDNYGIQIATSWIHRNQTWLAQNTSGVLLVQIRDSSSISDRLDIEDADPTSLEVVSRGFEFFTSPIDGINAARFATASFRNDADVIGLDSSRWEFLEPKPKNPGSFFTTVIFENSAEVSLDPGLFWDNLTKIDNDSLLSIDFREVAMSWYLTRAEKEAILRAIPSDPPADSPSNWKEPTRRAEIYNKLYGQVFAMVTDKEYYELTDQQRKEMRSKGTLCYYSGHDRDVRMKYLEQLINYQRLQNLGQWWGIKDKPVAKAP